MQYTILTLFPEMFDAWLNTSILKKAQDKNLIHFNLVNIRDYSRNKQKSVDDKVYGGGKGMLMTCQPLFDAIEMQLKTMNNPLVVYFTPQGEVLKQEKVESLSVMNRDMLLICGHYEGVDQRVIDTFVDLELSIGEYVLTGGELPAMVLIDSVCRLLPGVLGKEESHLLDSFSLAFDRKKEYPQYTRPSEFRGLSVPQVLLSGHDLEIALWKKNNLK